MRNWPTRLPSPFHNSVKNEQVMPAPPPKPALRTPYECGYLVLSPSYNASAFPAKQATDRSRPVTPDIAPGFFRFPAAPTPPAPSPSPALRYAPSAARTCSMFVVAQERIKSSKAMSVRPSGVKE